MKQNKRWLAALLLVVMMISLTACGEKKEEAPQPTEAPALAVHPIVGVWVQDREQMMQGVSQEEYEANKELYDTAENALEFTADGKLFMYITAGDLSDTREATYSVSGNQLTMVGSSGTYSIDGDTLTLVQGGISITYTRKK